MDFPINRILTTFLIACLVIPAVWAGDPIVIDEDTYIGPDDTSLHGESVIVDGAELTIDGTHSIESMEIINGGVLTHSVESDQPPHLILNSMFIDEDSAIDVTGKGQDQPSAMLDTVGASHGGWGAVISDQTTNLPYGSLREPVDLGTGAHHGRGGGALHLEVGSLQLDGTISANGEQRSTNWWQMRGFPSGGSIWIEVGILSGSGTIQARGGRSTNSNPFTGGGGGRIALYYGDLIDFDLLQISAQGGGPTGGGGAGTIYVKDVAETLGVVRIDNGETGPNSAGTEIGEAIHESLKIVDASVDLQGDISGLLEITSSQVDLNGDLLGNLVVAVDITIQQAGDVTVDVLELTSVDWLHTGDLTVVDLHHIGGTWYHSGAFTVIDSYEIADIVVTHAGPVSILGAETDYAVQPGVTVRLNHETAWQHVLVDGETLIVNVPQSWASLEVLNGGLVTHDEPSGESAFWLELTLGHLAIDFDSAIDVSAKGWNQQTSALH
jgi:hypothetical protein